jgi:hypothetical protein
MDSLLRRIKSRIWLPGGPGDTRLSVAAFGKHPGWDDHMEDLGLDTDALVAVKRILYVQGIAGNIERGQWSQLEKKQASIEFGHTFVWCRGEDRIAGRLWASRDGRGRTSYPMIVCAHCQQVPLPWLYERVLPRLVDLEARCRDTNSAGEVRSCLSQCQADLSALLDTARPSEADPGNGADPLARLAEHPELGPRQEGLIRILYHLDREILAGPLPPGDKGLSGPSALARVPLRADPVARTPLLWLQLLLARYGAARGVAVLGPASRAWLDLLVGEPGPAQLYCLRASLDALPLTTTVPYNVTPQFIDEVRQRIARSRTLLEPKTT